MNFNNQPVWRRSVSSDIDLGLRAYMMKVYNIMAAGLGISGLVAYFASTYEPLMRLIFQTHLMWFIMLAPFIMVMCLSSMISRLSPGGALALFVAYAATMGLSVSSIFLIYTHNSVLSIFAVSAALFLSMSLYGYVTKSNLASMGSFLTMGVFGLIIAMVINIFMKSSILSFALSALAVVIFTGLTAYDVQKIRMIYSSSDDNAIISKKAVFGALTLYLDFINIFLHMLQLTGERK